MAGRTKKEETPLAVPFRVMVDGREKHPYTFQGIKADKKFNCRPLAISWSWAHLLSGDYSIKDHESRVAIERKTLEDLYTTLGQRRQKFEEEHQRLAEMDFAAVIVEASLGKTLTRPPERSKLPPKNVYRTWLTWQVKYHVPWMFVDGRRLGEITTWRLLEKWWIVNVVGG